MCSVFFHLILSNFSRHLFIDSLLTQLLPLCYYFYYLHCAVQANYTTISFIHKRFCSQVLKVTKNNLSFAHFSVTASVYNLWTITELLCSDKLPQVLSFLNCFPSSCLSSSGSKVNCVPSADSFLRRLISPRLHSDHHCSVQPCSQWTSRRNKLCLLC